MSVQLSVLARQACKVDAQRNIVIDGVASLVNSSQVLADASAGFSGRSYAYEELKESFFPFREDCRVTLYQVS